MTDSIQVVVAVACLVAVFVGTRYIVAWRFRRAALAIIHDLEETGAVSEVTAIELPYGKANLLRLGMRDYRHKALEYMVAEGVVGRSPDGKHFLKIQRSQHS